MVAKMHWNKLQGTLIFKLFWVAPHSHVQNGGAPLQHLTPQVHRYRNQIVLQLLYLKISSCYFFFEFENPRSRQA